MVKVLIGTICEVGKTRYEETQALDKVERKGNGSEIFGPIRLLIGG